MNTNTEKDMKPKAEANLKELEKNESSEDLDEDSEIEDSHSDFELNEHIDCCDSVNKWLDAEIIALRNNEIRVHFSGWSNKYDDWIDKSSGRAQKQWTKGKNFKINNRLDIKDEHGKWLEARVIELNPKKIKVHFYNFSTNFDCWIEKTSDNIAEVGKFSKAFGQIKTKINSQPNKNLKACTNETTAQHPEIVNPHQYAQELDKHGFIIRPIGEDGNCLFRGVSDQIYGTEKYHSDIRAYCLKYIEIEHEYFRNFIEGGNKIDNFYLYLENKKKDGVWGDDVEIQALSEIYNRPIEIYVYSCKPIRTFHESSFDGYDPIRLSYHGKSHYNSIKKIDGGDKAKFLKQNFGELEENSIKTAKLRVESRKLSTMNEYDRCLFLSRNEFEIRNIRELEQALEESLSLNQKALEMKEIEEQLIEFSAKEFEKDSETVEKLIIEQAIQESLTSHAQHYQEDYATTPAVLKVVQEGFPLELAMQAYSLVGDDPALMIQFIEENMLS